MIIFSVDCNSLLRISAMVIICFRMDLAARLNSLSKSDAPERVKMIELTDSRGYRIISSKIHTHAQYGLSIILEVEVGSTSKVVFLPKRYSNSLNAGEIDRLGRGGYKIRCLGTYNNSPIVDIFEG